MTLIQRLSRSRTPLVMLALVSACTTDRPTTPEARSPSLNVQALASRELAQASAGRTSRGIEDEILRVESVVPGLGGMYVDAGGQLVLYVPASANIGSVRAALSRTGADLAIDADLRSRLVHGTGLKFVNSEFPFSDLVVFNSAISQRLSSVPDAWAVDADESTNRLIVTIANESGRAAVERLASEVGVPSRALTIEVKSRPSLTAPLRGTQYVTGGGFSIWNGSGFCSIGFNVTTSTGLTGMVTASHCAPGTVGAGNTGSPIWQSGDLLLGYVQTNPPWNSTDPNCGGYTSCTPADAMFVQFSDLGRFSKRVGFTNKLGINNLAGPTTVTGYWSNITFPQSNQFIGQSLDKMGRTTGWTRGTLAATCENFFVSGAMHLCVDHVNNAGVAGGDSGAPVFVPSMPSTQPLYPYGILFAGGPMNTLSDEGFPQCTVACSYWYTRWAAIQTTLGMTVSPN